jgi:hypothetical protein
MKATDRPAADLLGIEGHDQPSNGRIDDALKDGDPE